jgi:spore germination protein
VAELSAKLKPKGYQITIDVPAKTVDNPANGWSGAFDYSELAKYSDTLMLMTYDEHESHGAPGPIASVGFVEKCLQYATSVVPKEKLMLGIPFYGYDWADKGRCKCLWYSKNSQFIQDKKIKTRWDSDSKCPWYCYKDERGQKRTAWYENARSTEAKLKLGAEFDVAGICIWSLGDEDPATWKAIREFRKR